ncbi:MAG: excinuclease ABC subunit UvrC [Deltaproteobacteria bacterium]|nr:excinuclease ABC subunit UvrC [Deltaproteobacteria bacterium]
MKNYDSQLSMVASGPGVYLMLDDAGGVIYVGKARNLKKRLSSYFKSPERLDIKTRVLVRKIAGFDTILTASEKEALILESTLIKKYRPRYNVILKDGKRYPALRFEITHPYPRLTIVRKIENDGNLYFGPFSSTQAVRSTLKIVNKTFKLRKCSNREFKTRVRPCINFQMLNCLAPCCIDIKKSVYNDMVREVTLFLKSRTRELATKIKKEMLAAAETRDFEKAAELRDKMFAIEKTLEKQVMVTTDLKDRDVVGMAAAPEAATVTLLTVRGGHLQGVGNFNFSTTMATDAEIISSFIKQYYDTKNFIPAEILTPMVLKDANLLEEWLLEHKEIKLKILHPRRGEKVRLLEMALQNAEHHLKNHIADIAGRKELLIRLQKRLLMHRFPQRIECFDNSNFSGTQAVSGMVVFINGRPSKTDYRKYILHSVSGSDDYAGMAEVLERRFSHNPKPYPDLLLIDGGKGQIGIARSVIRKLGLENRFALIGIAKKNEQKGEIADKIYKPGRMNPINWGREGDLLLFLQKIRDEAHRFAITFHRQRRSKASKVSVLDSIPGIGEKRKQTILRHFGSLKKIRAATLEELSALPQMNRKAAKAVITALAAG